MRRLRTAIWPFPLTALAVTGLAIGCDSEEITAPPPVDHAGEPVVAMVIAVDGLEVEAGHHVPLKAVGVCKHGYAMREITDATWAVDDDRMAIVDEDGRLHAIHSGTVNVSAENRYFAATLELEVHPYGGNIGWPGGEIESLDESAVIAVPPGVLGHYEPFTLETVFTEDLGVAAEGIVGEAYNVDVLDAECSPEFELTLVYGENSAPNAMEAPWFRLHRLENGVWVEIVNSTVDLEAKTVSAFVDKRGTYAILPSKPRIAWIEIVPGAVEMAPGATAAFVAIVYDEKGNERPATAVEWSVDDPTVATVDENGLVTAHSPGAAVLTALAEGVAGNADIVVKTDVHSIVTTERAITLTVGDTYALSGLAIDFAGKDTGRPLAWKSDDITIVRVDAAGLVTAMAVGRTKVRAEADGHWTTVIVTVVPAAVPIASMRITPMKSVLHVGEHVELMALFFDANGDPVAGGPVTWTSLDPGWASVGPRGLATALDCGVAVIEAVSGSLRATAEIIIVAPIG